ncbi:hypothetical protein J40TS1_30980 [Paenibacillus montaniterrae]|uniref:Uncharacterized protein n=1 Tax=Paenibacillus montaniterrae TaxID=429341 RepID=A0A919YUD5_9BACL|nr:hypothetical protein [Paenibacillus montaniterrae]GIP17456.1 hypothetical protein J40TS1_30980 [Paenibacillus montaniterrae]
MEGYLDEDSFYTEEDSKLVVQYTATDQGVVQLELIQPSKKGDSGSGVITQEQFDTKKKQLLGL